MQSDTLFDENSFGRLIALAGRQRMLSQQAGLALMLAASEEKHSVEQVNAIKRFETAIATFAASHETVLSTISDIKRAGIPFAEVSELLVDGQKAISVIQSFIERSNLFLRTMQSSGEIAPSELREYARYAMGALLDQLESIVAAIQADAEAFNAGLQVQRQKNSDIIEKSVEDILSAAAYSRMVALNAKISAGRAGSFGAEFSALTNEIKDVAERISSSSAQIRDSLAS